MDLLYLDDICDEVAGEDLTRFVRAKHLFVRWINQIPELKKLATIQDCDICITNVAAFHAILQARVEDGTLKSAILAAYLQNKNLRPGA